MFKTPEYQHLLLAERVMAETIEKAEGKPSELAACARALADIVQLKRNMRGDPNPKPIDTLELERKKAKDKERRDGAQVDYRKRKPAQEPSAPNVTPMPDASANA